MSKKKEGGAPGPCQDQNTITTNDYNIILLTNKTFVYYNRFWVLKSVYSSIKSKCKDIYIYLQLLKTVSTPPCKTNVRQFNNKVIYISQGCLV